MRPKKSMQGQIVEVEGGRILRALGRKDRHSKVCTAKGPKDRRVRLSANTAIQFYDVQDRLGYDRPSKAIDWLMNEAKAAIDALNGHLDHDLPPTIYNPTSTIAVTQYYHQSHLDGFYDTNQPHCDYLLPHENRTQNQQQNVTDTQANSFVGFFNNYADGLNSRNRSQAQDLCLALQSYQQDPMILLQDTTTTTTTTTLFSANSTPLDFEGTAEMFQFQRMFSSNSNPISSNGKESSSSPAAAAQGSTLFEINSSLPRHLEPYLDQNHSLFSQRESLQSSFMPSIQASFPAPPFGINGFANDGFSGSSFPRQEEKHQSSATSVLHYQD